jgi:2-C-methyl-D-erythritol 4-phosphate cytidylyltransferase/2-C-methyl-D-erythritol 2,4-cyclodiphosphate synthase
VADARPPTTAALIVAAGSGSRMAEPGLPAKQYRRVGGVPVLKLSLSRFLGHPHIARVGAVIHPDAEAEYHAAVAGLEGLDPPAFGGATRQDSVRLGLEALAASADPPAAVLIHDAARPFVTPLVIARAVAALQRADAVLVAQPIVDTLKRAGPGGRVAETVPRESLWAAQTPQGFRFGAILEAHRRAAAAGRLDFTDDAAVAAWAGLDVTLVEGAADNIKLTTPADFAAAEGRCRMEAWLATADIRVGTGYDVHRFVPGDAVVLCGVSIPHEARLDGHSDADVALHALTDALLGAIGDGDIGVHFPPSEAQWRGAASEIFVRAAAARVAARGGVIAHVDIGLIAEAPKIGPHREAMRAAVAAMLGLDLDRVAVKATTNEKLGFIGRREGIAAIATATVRLPAPF